MHNFEEELGSYPFPKQALVLRVCSTSLLKTLWENEKLLVTHRLYKYSIILDVTFLEKKSMVTLANGVWQEGPGTSGLFHPTLL